MPEPKDGTLTTEAAEREPSTVSTGEPAVGGDGSDDKAEIQKLRSQLYESQQKISDLENRSRPDRATHEQPPTHEESELRASIRHKEKQLQEARRLAETDPASGAAVTALEVALQVEKNTAKRLEDFRVDIYLENLPPDEAKWVKQYWKNGDGEYKTIRAAHKGFLHDYAVWEKEQEAKNGKKPAAKPVPKDDEPVSTAARPETRRAPDGKFESDMAKVVDGVKTYGDWNRAYAKATKDGDQSTADALYKKYESGQLVADE